MATCEHYFRCVRCGLAHDDHDDAETESDLREHLASERARRESAEAALRYYLPDSLGVMGKPAREHFGRYPEARKETR